MRDGERVTVQGSSGTYELSRVGEVYACTCPAWRKQAAPPMQRSCKHLRAYLGEGHEAARLAGSKVAAAQGRARRSAARAPQESQEMRRRREAAVASALARFPAAAARMQATYGMRLPLHLAYGAAFWLGLTAEEAREAWAYLGNGLVGVGTWFEPGGLERPARLDERLHYRYRCDPPEFVTVFSGSSDGKHWGLWYDDPHELPRLVAYNYARDDAVTHTCHATLLGALHDEMTLEWLPPEEWPHAARVLAWLDEMHARELAAHAEEAIPPPPGRTNECVAGLDPVLAGAKLPADLVGNAAQEARLKVYREEPARALRWIEQAHRELAAGQPLRALFLGRELHWFDSDPLREATTALMIAAYEATGRHPLAEIVKVHHAHRDLRSVAIYGEVPVPPLVEAARAGDLAAVESLLAAGTPDAGELAAALLHARATQVVETLLARAPATARDAKLASLIGDLGELARSEVEDRELLAQVDLLLARGAPVSLAFARALEEGLPALALELTPRVDPRAADERGATPLHHAAQAGALEVAAQLLERGADPEARDAAGATPLDHARALWLDRREASHALLALLKARAAPTATPTGELQVGDVVEHPRFGPGEVTARDGAGEAAKLTIAFTDATRTLLARFVRRA